MAYVVVTTEPTSKVHPIQPKAMPVVLRETMWEDWLRGNAAEVLGLQRRVDDDVVELAWIGADDDLAAVPCRAVPCRALGVLLEARLVFWQALKITTSGDAAMVV